MGYHTACRNDGSATDSYMGQNNRGRTYVSIVLDTDRDEILQFFSPGRKAVDVRQDQAAHSKLHIVSDRYPLRIGRFDHHIEGDVNSFTDFHASFSMRPNAESKTSRQRASETLEHTIHDASEKRLSRKFAPALLVSECRPIQSFILRR